MHPANIVVVLFIWRRAPLHIALLPSWPLGGGDASFHCSNALHHAKLHPPLPQMFGSQVKHIALRDHVVCPNLFVLRNEPDPGQPDHGTKRTLRQTIEREFFFHPLCPGRQFKFRATKRWRYLIQRAAMFTDKKGL